MNNLSIEATKYTPRIHFQADKHHLIIEGESYPENTIAFYQEVFDWLETYLETYAEEPLTVRIKISYFNSSSSKALFDLFDMLDQSAEQGKKISVSWLYAEGDDIAQEYGEDFQMDLESLDFELIEFADGEA
ncbi:MAG: hypothetical protein CR997_09430 [Acidobacteria bacterium]|nr:MAG: hypothetical protein CR997_09430 [Acidobacteriota bacterium]